MDTRLSYAMTRLKEGALLRIRNAEGQAIAVFGGLVWVTQEGDRRDVFLGSGETFTIDRPGQVIAQAMQDSNLLVLETERIDGVADERAFA